MPQRSHLSLRHCSHNSNKRPPCTALWVGKHEAWRCFTREKRKERMIGRRKVELFLILAPLKKLHITFSQHIRPEHLECVDVEHGWTQREKWIKFHHNKKWVRVQEGWQMENKVHYEDAMAAKDKKRVCVGTEVWGHMKRRTLCDVAVLLCNPATPPNMGNSHVLWFKCTYNFT